MYSAPTLNAISSPIERTAISRHPPAASTHRLGITIRLTITVIGSQQQRAGRSCTSLRTAAEYYLCTWSAYLLPAPFRAPTHLGCTGSRRWEMVLLLTRT